MLTRSSDDGKHDGSVADVARIVALGGVLVCLALFAVLTHDVTHAGPFSVFDARYLLARRSLATPEGVQWFAMLTTLGSPVAMTILAVGGGLWLGFMRRWPLLIGWVGAFTGSALIVELAKRAIHHPRPAGAAQFLYGMSYSFPSGHVVGSLVGYGMLAYVLRQLIVRRALATAALYFGTVCLVATIAWSRIYLGVHFVSDVAGGVAVGSAWLIVAVMSTQWLCKHHADERRVSAKRDPEPPTPTRG